MADPCGSPLALAIGALPGAGRDRDARCRLAAGPRLHLESPGPGGAYDRAGYSHGGDYRSLDAGTALAGAQTLAGLPSDGPPDQLRPLSLRARQRAQREL